MISSHVTASWWSGASAKRARSYQAGAGFCQRPDCKPREMVERSGAGLYDSPVRALLRLLVCLATSAAIAAAVVPAQAVAPQAKAGCCATMKMDAPADDCGHHAPKSNQEKECCAACMSCLAVLSSVTPFVYPPTGEESFAAFTFSGSDRSHRPPVPPPRA